jgi:Tfp pilus assembly protein PilF
MGIGAINRGNYVQAVSDAISIGDLARAADLATTALRNDFQHPAFFNARALHLQEQGRLPEALAEFQQALPFMPNDPTLLNAIGLCAVRANRAQEGLAAFKRALAAQPDNPVTHFRTGWAHASAGDQGAARKSYERAIELKPDYAEALAALASIAAREEKTDEARDYAARSLAIDPAEPTAIVALAMVENAAGEYAKAEALINEELKDKRAIGHTRGVLLGFLGDALDGQDRIGEAFAAYTAKGAEFRRLHEARLGHAPSATKMMGSLAAYLESTPEERWKAKAQPKAVAGAPREHVFLLGFLRSGTTLLERILDMHPDVVNLEERDTLAALSQQFMSIPAGLNRLTALEGKALDDARESYWRGVRAFGVEPEGKVFIDKQPLNTFNLPLIAKLFPEARILFAVRDPRDVLFSCFRRHFEVNPVMYEFLDLVSGARFYDAVMNVGEISRQKLPLTLHEHRYEDMIADFDGRVRAVCDFLNIEWTDAMRDFSSKARETTIRSPSAAQVRKPLYGEGVGQWRRYAQEFAPAQPILARWIERFGYRMD